LTNYFRDDKNEPYSISAHITMSIKFAKREAIIQAAIKVFSKSSFRDSSISEIAGKANAVEGVWLFAVLYLLFLWQGL
jgi:hypothetical protein